MPDPFTKSDALELFLYPFADTPTSFLAVGTLPGLIITNARHRNGEGKGFLRFKSDGTLASWKAPGSLQYGAWVNVSALGEYLLEDGEDPNKSVRVETVSAAHLPASAQEVPVYLESTHGGDRPFFGDVLDGQAGEVVVVTRQLFNHGRSVMSNLVVWIDPASSYLEIDVGGGYSSPTTEETALLIGTLLPLNSTLFDVRRTIPALTGPEPELVMELHFRWDAP